jgi:hypothetical protein
MIFEIEDCDNNNRQNYNQKPNWNISNDQYYGNVPILTASSHQIEHTSIREHKKEATSLDPTFYFYVFSLEQLCTWGRPNILSRWEVAKKISLDILRLKKQKNVNTILNTSIKINTNPSIPNKTKHNTCKTLNLPKQKTTYILLEYMEQHPVLLQNYGMASNIFILKQNGKDGSDVCVPKELVSTFIYKTIKKTDASPFIGELPKEQSLLMFDNTLFLAPIFYHPILNVNNNNKTIKKNQNQNENQTHQTPFNKQKNDNEFVFYLLHRKHKAKRQLGSDLEQKEEHKHNKQATNTKNKKTKQNKNANEKENKNKNKNKITNKNTNKDKNNNKDNSTWLVEEEWFLEIMPAAFTVGQQHPKQLVPLPNSHLARAILYTKIDLLIRRTLAEKLSVWSKQQGKKQQAQTLQLKPNKKVKKITRKQEKKEDDQNKNGNQLAVKLADIFPNLNSELDAIVRPGLAKYAKFDRTTLHWYIDSNSLNGEVDKTLCTPEKFCVYDSMVSATFRLNQILEQGIPDLALLKKWIMLFGQNHQEKNIISYIYMTYIMAPWNTTRAFLSTLTMGAKSFIGLKKNILLNGKLSLLENGYEAGNPFGSGWGFSYVACSITDPLLTESTNGNYTQNNKNNKHTKKDKESILKKMPQLQLECNSIFLNQCAILGGKKNPNYGPLKTLENENKATAPTLLNKKRLRTKEEQEKLNDEQELLNWGKTNKKLKANLLLDLHKEQNIMHEEQNIMHAEQNIMHAEQNIMHGEQNVMHGKQNVNVKHKKQNFIASNRNLIQDQTKTNTASTKTPTTPLQRVKITSYSFDSQTMNVKKTVHYSSNPDMIEACRLDAVDNGSRMSKLSKQKKGELPFVGKKSIYSCGVNKMLIPLANPDEANILYAYPG